MFDYFFINEYKIGVFKLVPSLRLLSQLLYLLSSWNVRRNRLEWQMSLLPGRSCPSLPSQRRPRLCRRSSRSWPAPAGRRSAPRRPWRTARPRPSPVIKEHNNDIYKAVNWKAILREHFFSGFCLADTTHGGLLCSHLVGWTEHKQEVMLNV